ncbi:cell envelope integrity protein TolA [Rugamonas sp.]|uniref:cell envelope integrity protein TolA n=1 Tax=Rugamonas sp. TaxID=1926287 RepID=UPI00260046DE|nr:cell envelope integrity protein TolA [Rugamonas sp.]
MKPSSTGAPYKVPRQHDGWRSLTLAAAMHAVLILFLWVGVHWQSNKPVAVEAEVWDMSVQQAAPPAPTPPPAPEPEPEPVVKAPPPPVAPPVEAPPAPKAPDIALERLKAKKKLAEEKLEEAKEAAKLKKQADEKLAKLKAKDDAKKKELAEQKAQEEKDKQDELDKKLQADKDKKAAADKLAKAKATEQKAADKARAAEMSRITGAVGSGAVGTAAKSTGPKGDAGYGGALQAAIRSRLAYSSSDDSLAATVKITQLPTGEVIGTKMVKSSGVAAYDNAILRAIEAASPLPKKKDGTVEREITADFNLKDLH